MLSISSPLVSVITPVLNSVNTLEVTLLSVAAQTYSNVEHIVIDGGSTDGTVDLIREFQSNVPLRWVSEPDAGMYAAINKGLELAQGEIISYLNGDDLYFPWSVDTAVTSLSSNNAHLAFGDLLVVVKRDGLSFGTRIQFYPQFRPSLYAHEVSMGQPTVFWRRQVSDTLGGFDEQMRYSGDFEFWLRTGRAGFRYTHIREVLAVAVEHEAALSTVHLKELEQEINQARARYADVTPRKFAPLRALTRLIHWRSQALMFRLNLRRRRPSGWANLIDFFRGAEITLEGSSVIPLLVPLPLPRSWSMLKLDPADFEGKLTAELLNRCSEVSD